MGMTAEDLMAKLYPHLSKERHMELFDRCCQVENTYLREHGGVLYPQLEETLEALSQKLPLFIVSNCQAGYIEVFLETSGLGSYFEGHLCPGDTGNAKADNICKIIQEYHLKAPVYVGDTLGDFNATKTAGIPFVFASYGFGQVPSPDYTIHCPGDLLNIF